MIIGRIISDGKFMGKSSSLIFSWLLFVLIIIAFLFWGLSLWIHTGNRQTETDLSAIEKIIAQHPDSALTLYLNALNESKELKDFQLTAALYMKCAEIYKSQELWERYVEANRRACVIYAENADSIPYLECRLNILNGYMQLNDSLSAQAAKDSCEIIAKSLSDAKPAGMRNQLLKYYIRYGSKEDIENMLSNNISVDSLSSDEIFTLAEAQKTCGRNKESLATLYFALRKMPSHIALGDSLRYQRIKSEVYEANGMYPEALAEYKEYIDKRFEQYNAFFKSRSRFADVRSEIELDSQRAEAIRKQAEMFLFMTILLLILSVLISILLLQSNRRHKRRMEMSKISLNLRYKRLWENNLQLSSASKDAHDKMEKTKAATDELISANSRLEISLSALEEEVGCLKRILKSESNLDSIVINAINQRVVVLDDLLGRAVSGSNKYSEDFVTLLTNLKENQAEFLHYVRESFMTKTPKFKRYCRECGLTDKEMDFVVLSSLGMSNKEIGTFFGLSRINVMSSSIREKLNISKNKSIINKYIKSAIEAEAQGKLTDFLNNGIKFLILITGIGLGLLSGGCSRPEVGLSEAQCALISADSLIHTDPDSALMLLESADVNSLHEKQERARYALLLARARDLNKVKFKDAADLAPAIEYYGKGGSSEERLITRYYQGRTALDNGDTDQAFIHFLRALDDSAKCKDKEMLAKAYVASGYMYAEQFELSAQIKAIARAKELYRQIKDTAKYQTCNYRILQSAIHLEDKRLADSIFADCQRFESRVYETFWDYLSLAISYYQTFYPQNEVIKFIESDDNLKPDSLTFYQALNIAYAYALSDNPTPGIKYINKAKEIDPDFESSPIYASKFYSIASIVYENNNATREALEAYRQFIHFQSQEYNDLLNNDVLFVIERHEKERESIKRNQSYIYKIMMGFIIFMVFMIIIFGVYTLINYLHLGKRDIGMNLWRYSGKYIENEHLNMTLLDYLSEIDTSKKHQSILRKEKARLQRKIDRLNKEKVDLVNLSNTPSVNEDLAGLEIISQRVRILDGLILSLLTGSKQYAEEYQNLEDSIRTNPQEFFKYLIDSYKLSHPQLIEECEDCGLTEREMGCVCLVALGLSNNEIGEYLGLKRINSLMSTIRKKLNVPKAYKTLSDYIEAIMDT